MITVLLEPEDFERGRAELMGDAYRHLFRARRLAAGEELRAVDGQGRARRAKVSSIDRRRAELELGEDLPPHEPDYRLELLVASPRPERASFLVEKATELGVWAVRFLASERAPRKYGERQLERLTRVARAAVEQCQRARVPEVTGVHAWEELGELLGAAEDRWLLDPAADGGPGLERSGESGAVVIGPEGGFTAAELAQLDRLDCRRLSLGERILRIETAALAASAWVLTRGGDGVC